MTALTMPADRHLTDAAQSCYSSLLGRELDAAEAWSLVEAIELFEWICKEQGVKASEVNQCPTTR